MNKDTNGIKILLALIVGLLFLNLVDGRFQTKTAVAENPPEYSVLASPGLSPMMGHVFVDRTLSEFGSTLQEQAKKGWRFKGVASSESGRGFTTLYVVMEK